MSLSKAPNVSLVVLQVGDRRFTTREDTLTGGSEYFASMFSGRWTLEPQEDGSYFLDAEADAFEHVLRYLRQRIYPLLYNGSQGQAVPFDYILYMKIQRLAEFLVIPTLAAWIKEQRYLQVVTIDREVVNHKAPQTFRKGTIDDSIPPSGTAAANVQVSYQPIRRKLHLYVDMSTDRPEHLEYEVLSYVETRETTKFNRAICMEE